LIFGPQIGVQHAALYVSSGGGSVSNPALILSESYLGVNYASSSFDVVAGRLYIAVIAGGFHDFDATALTLTDWTSVVSLNKDSPPGWPFGMAIWWRVFGSDTSTTVTATSATTLYGGGTVILELTGHNGTPIAQTKSANSGVATDGAYQLALDGAPASSSMVIGALQRQGSESNDAVPDTGWTQIAEIALSNGSALQVQYRGSSTSANIDWSDVSASGGGSEGTVAAGFEIAAA
jgi:hypothetical protein